MARSMASGIVDRIRAAVTTDPREGVVVGIKRRRALAMGVVEQYSAMAPPARANALVAVARTLQRRIPAKSDWSRMRSEPLRRVVDALQPGYVAFFQLVASVPQGVEFLLGLREDVMILLKDARWQGASGGTCPGDVALLEDLDETLRRLFGTQQAVQLRRLPYASKAAVRYIVAKEAVRPFRGERDARNRFDGPNRAVYGLFHSALPGKPLVFVESALGRTFAHHVDRVLEGDDVADTAPTHVTFYGITNTRPGLKGLQLASHLLFVAVDKLSSCFPSLSHFGTLSPVPGFRRWLWVSRAASHHGPPILIASHALQYAPAHRPRRPASKPAGPTSSQPTRRGNSLRQPAARPSPLHMTQRSRSSACRKAPKAPKRTLTSIDYARPFRTVSNGSNASVCHILCLQNAVRATFRCR